MAKDEEKKVTCPCNGEVVRGYKFGVGFFLGVLTVTLLIILATWFFTYLSRLAS